MSLMKVFCFSLFIMFSSAAYLPVLDVGLEGMTGERGVAFAMGWGPDGHRKKKDRDGKHGPITVPEPSTLILLGAGASGVGIYAALKRRKK